MKPPSGYKHIDTKQIASRNFGFTSNKLEYLTDKLCVRYKKQKHKKFSGFDLWKECLAGNPKAWAEMERYNKYDVLSLEELYTKLQPWAANTPVFARYTDETEFRCNCGSARLIGKGYAYTSVGKYQRYKCQDCGKQFTSNKNILIKEKGAGIIK